MEIVSFGLMIAVPFGFLMWALSKKDLMSVLAVPFIMILFFAVLSLNTDPVLTWKQADRSCDVLVMNSTVNGNFTSYGVERQCDYGSTDIDYTVAPEALLVMNTTMGLGTMAAFFVVFYRSLMAVKNYRKNRQQAQA